VPAPSAASASAPGANTTGTSGAMFVWLQLAEAIACTPQTSSSPEGMARHFLHRAAIAIERLGVLGTVSAASERASVRSKRDQSMRQIARNVAARARQMCRRGSGGAGRGDDVLIHYVIGAATFQTPKRHQAVPTMSLARYLAALPNTRVWFVEEAFSSQAAPTTHEREHEGFRACEVNPKGFSMERTRRGGADDGVASETSRGGLKTTRYVVDGALPEGDRHAAVKVCGRHVLALVAADGALLKDQVMYFQRDTAACINLLRKYLHCIISGAVPADMRPRASGGGSGGDAEPAEGPGRRKKGTKDGPATLVAAARVQRAAKTPPQPQQPPLPPPPPPPPPPPTPTPTPTTTPPRPQPASGTSPARSAMKSTRARPGPPVKAAPAVRSNARVQDTAPTATPSARALRAAGRATRARQSLQVALDGQAGARRGVQ
jgi:hypothetical protein